MKSAFKVGVLITFCAFVALRTGFSQSAGLPVIAVDIPFSFEAAGMSMPAGHYVLRHFPNPNWILIVNRDQRSVATVPVQESQAPTTAENPKLVFHRYGDTYYLSQVWTSQDSQMHLCYKSNSELAMAKRYESPTVVAVAGRAASEATR